MCIRPENKQLPGLSDHPVLWRKKPCLEALCLTPEPTNMLSFSPILQYLGLVPICLSQGNAQCCQLSVCTGLERVLPQSGNRAGKGWGRATVSRLLFPSSYSWLEPSTVLETVRNGVHSRAVRRTSTGRALWTFLKISSNFLRDSFFPLKVWSFFFSLVLFFIEKI